MISGHFWRQKLLQSNDDTEQYKLIVAAEAETSVNIWKLTEDQRPAAAEDTARTSRQQDQRQRDGSGRAVIHQRMRGAAGKQRPALFALRSSESRAAGTFFSEVRHTLGASEAGQMRPDVRLQLFGAGSQMRR